MDYVRVDFKDRYIYFVNNTSANDFNNDDWDDDTMYCRARELLSQKPMWAYQRIKRMETLPIDKQPYVWYNKGTKQERK